MRNYWLLICLLLSVSQLNAQLEITELSSKNQSMQADFQGDHTDLIEITNDGPPVNLSDFYLSDKIDHLDKWPMPNLILNHEDIIVIHASGKDTVIGNELHTNFKLQQKGLETVYISDASLNILDSVHLPCIPDDHSYSKLIHSFYLDSLPNFGHENNILGLYSLLPDELVWTHDAGLYSSTVNLGISSLNGYGVKVSIDGDYPSPDQNDFFGTVSISESHISPLSMISTSEHWEEPEGKVLKATVVAAQSFFHGCPLSEKEKRTFIVTPNIEERYPAIVSLSFESEDIFGYEDGIYVPGATGLNFRQTGKDWEREVYFEYFDGDGTRTISTPGGLRITGSGSRQGPQKSLRFYLRDEYGSEEVQNFAWEDRSESLEVRRWLLRSGNSDFLKSLIRDHVLSKALEGTDMDYQASDPVVVFMNGEYWGIQFIKERHDVQHLARKHNISEDHINIIETDGIVNEGDGDSFGDLVDFARYNDLSDPENYKTIIEHIDLKNYVDYMVTYMFFANWDWPFKNVKLWNSDYDHPKFRWLVFDGDAMFYKSSSNFFNKLIMEKDEADVNYILFTSLMENDSFQDYFKLRAIQLVQTTLSPDHMIRILDNLEDELTPFIPEHVRRWHAPASMLQWHDDISEMRFFFQNRSQSFLYDLEEEIGMSFNVHPNPSRDILYVPENLTGIDFRFDIFDRMGRRIREGRSSGQQSINISDLEPGVFTLRVFIDGIALYSKFVKV